MFVACGIWCLADVSSVSSSSEQSRLFKFVLENSVVKSELLSSGLKLQKYVKSGPIIANFSCLNTDETS